MSDGELRKLLEALIVLGFPARRDECETLDDYFDPPIELLLQRAVSQDLLRQTRPGLYEEADLSFSRSIREEMSERRRKKWNRRILRELRRELTGRTERSDPLIRNEPDPAPEDQPEPEETDVDSFLSKMSRQLREPLNVIVGYSEMALDDLDPDRDDALAESLTGIYNASLGLFDTIDELENRVVRERKQRQLSDTVRSLSTMIASTLDFEEVLDRVLASIGDIVPFDRATIRIPQDDHFIVLSSAEGEESEEPERNLEEVSRIDNPIHNRIIDQGDPIRDTDDQGDSRLGVPLFVNDQVVGTLILGTREDDAFDRYDARLMRALGHHVGMAVTNAQQHSQVRRRADFDPLTNVHSKHHFFEIAKRKLEQQRSQREPVSALMVDIDHFKHVNDTFGHAVGDRVLEEVGTRFQEQLREADIVGRYGGEEFSVLLPGADSEAAKRIGERLRTSISEAAFEVEDETIEMTVSIGVTSAIAEDDLDTLFVRADEALLRAKREGRDRVLLKEPDP